MKVGRVVLLTGFGLSAVFGNVAASDDDPIPMTDSTTMGVAKATTSMRQPNRSISSSIQTETPQDLKPWIGIKTRANVRRKIEAAFEIAVRQIRDVESCESLFAELGADGVEMLETALYFPATAYRESTLCRKAVAATHVGGSPTVICREIASYSDEEAAMVLIHEALHHAGLTESSGSRKSNISEVINHTVGKRCGY